MTNSRNHQRGAICFVAVCIFVARIWPGKSKETETMSITLIDTTPRRKESVPAGTVRQIIPSDDGARDVRAAIQEIEPGKSAEFHSENRSHLLYVIEGEGGKFSFKGARHAARKGAGLYLEPG